MHQISAGDAACISAGSITAGNIIGWQHIRVIVSLCNKTGRTAADGPAAAAPLIRC